MAPRISTLCFCLLFLYCCCLTQGELVLDCCLKVSDKEIPKSVIKGYHHQVKGQGCDISATIFTSKRGLKLCAPVALTVEWVQTLITFHDNKMKWCSNRKFRPKSCNGLKAENN
ncbi:C-C motif chemokine 20-like [Megalops cyprinoides]|uniref:C-C motif chemokine 20-like n=1 Tax=Megalops cyprinoides TaxID=118141 RepID=UPI001864C10D|nr:C-C motif chemokine 20-like [Megalops cyprinoides]